MTQFYSYLWLRVDGSPYYAGKGSGRRAFINHRRICVPKNKARILVFPMLNEAEALESEISLIDLFGRKDLGTGCLHNLTSGGEIPINLSPESHQRMSEAARRNRNSTGHRPTSAVREYYRNLYAGKKRGPYSLEHGEHISAAKRAKGIHLSAEQYNKLISPENRRKAWDTRFLKTVAWG